MIEPTTRRSNTDARLAERWLLGRLDPDVAAAFEARLVEEDTVFDAVETVEAELTEKYWRKALAPDVRADFERYYLAVRRNRERAALVCALLERASAASMPVPPVVGAAGAATSRVVPIAALLAPSLALALRASSAVRALLPARAVAAPTKRRPSRYFAPFAAAAMIGALAIGLAIPLRNTTAPTAPVTLELDAGRLRNAVLPQPIARLTADAPLELALDLPDFAPPDVAFDIAIEVPDGRAVWQGRADTELVAGRRALRLRIPAGTLASDDYVLAVQRTEAPAHETVAEYFFRVDRR